MSAWENISNFNSMSNFKNFISWIEEQIQEKKCEEVAVKNPFINSTLLEKKFVIDNENGVTHKEKWVRNIADGIIWRIVWPDPPFGGIFEPVKKEELDMEGWDCSRGKLGLGEKART